MLTDNNYGMLRPLARSLARSLAHTARRLRNLRASSSSTASEAAKSSSTHDPLRPTFAVSDLGLPLTPLPKPIPSIPRAEISRATLLKLHELSALNPPPEGSEEEAALLDDLGELVGLMELVAPVELGSDVGELLGEGTGEVVFDVDHLEARGRDEMPANVDKADEGEGRPRGRELLEYATRRVGDYYGFKAARRQKEA